MMTLEEAVRNALDVYYSTASGEPYYHQRAKAMETLRNVFNESRSLTFDALRTANSRRCPRFGHTIKDWTLTDWATAVAGEVGELCNEIKKVRRRGSRWGVPASDRQTIAREAADAVIYLDLLCARADIDLGEAVREKFNLVSRERLEGCDITL